MLREHLDRATDSSKAGWKALVDEDRVLSKLEGLEAQIQVYAKVCSVFNAMNLTPDVQRAYS